MAVGDRQKIITDILSKVLGEPAQINKKFDWFINKHSKQHFDSYFTLIDKIFETLCGDIKSNQLKRQINLKCDAYFGGEYNFIFEFDEFQHFSSARLSSLELYPKELVTGFPITSWIEYCNVYKVKADKYRSNKKTKDFNFIGGRTAQRAYLDCFRDLLPSNNGLAPTLRIANFEVQSIHSDTIENHKKIEILLRNRL